MVYDGYAPLDFWGPMQIFTALSFQYNMSLAVISKQIGPVSSSFPPRTLPNGEIIPNAGINSSVLATHTPEDSPELDLLLVPGAAVVGVNSGNDTWKEDFVKARFDHTDYIVSVCTGSMTLAKAGVLENKRATTNKLDWNEVVRYGKNVNWIPTARWTHDGKIWTSSGVAAGMDMTYALLSWMYGSEKVNFTMNLIELSPHTNQHWDPYSVVHKVPGANITAPLKDLVGPVGFD
ncbi:class I glutamine amidotransferase-like protein [Dendryphion nanum]|uniref:Class I glutamine amidotransferase-like protein n=1 Tax=Dendryphion nanum TaxID=256645 RepID=A0A9P9IFG9_9PLEO|nr:class I glutamine amidotransferase-like protein [Dendryphion nanum]